MGVYFEKDRKTFRIEFEWRGERYKKSADTDKKWLAEKREEEWKQLIKGSAHVDADCYRYTVAELYEKLLISYGKKLPPGQQKPILEGAQQCWDKRLAKKFGHLKAMEITSDHLEAYQDWCRQIEQKMWEVEIEKPLAPATINRDLSALGRAFNLAVQKRKIPAAPFWSKLDESSPRQGFVTEEEYRRLVEHAHELWLRGLLGCGYTYGFRRGEMLAMRVEQLDFEERVILLYPGETKNGEGRQVVMTQEVYDILQFCVADKEPRDYVFTRGGKPVLDFRGAWESLCNEAGMPELLFHDLRRSAIRNMIRRGVDVATAMKISGHRTVSVFQRYNIIDLTVLREATAKLEIGTQRDREAIARKASRRAVPPKSPQTALNMVQSRNGKTRVNAVN